ncbi:MAG: ParB/RepB/Spo0J family partition protein [Rikenellaceae bacterium]
MKQQKGLGRGLDSLFASGKVEPKIKPMSELTEVSIDKISANPTQPRRSFDEGALAELATSIKELGIIQPVTLRSCDDGHYTIISGERRWRAAQMAGLTQLPAYIREVDDEAMHTMALVENIQRAELNPIEIAFGLQRLIEECQLTQEALAQRVTLKRSSISNYLRLLKMSDQVQYALKQGLITMGHAKAIASVECEQGQLELLAICIEQGISVREAEQRGAKLNAAEQSERPKIEAREIPKGYESLSARLGGIFSKGVEIKANSRGGGRIVINFSSRSEIQQLLQELNIEE